MPMPSFFLHLKNFKRVYPILLDVCLNLPQGIFKIPDSEKCRGVNNTAALVFNKYKGLTIWAIC